MNYFDLHCDTIAECWKQKKDLWDNDLHLCLKRGAAYHPWLQCFAAWIPDELRGEGAYRYFEEVYGELLRQEALHGDKLKICRDEENFQEAARTEKCGAIFTVEGGAALGGRLERVARLKECGVKAVTLTWNASCEIGDGAEVAHPKGLTPFGREVVRELERNRIAVDVSHASEPLFWEVAERAQRPFLATHSNARALCNNPRNLTDSQFCAVRDRGGVVGVTFVRRFLDDSWEAGMDDLLRHIEHFLSLGGEKTVALGGDFDGTDLPDGMTGVESVEALGDCMLRHNYPESLVQAIFFDNAYRFFTSL